MLYFGAVTLCCSLRYVPRLSKTCMTWNRFFVGLYSLTYVSVDLH